MAVDPADPRQPTPRGVAKADLTDRELMTLVQADDPHAFGLLYDRLAGRGMSIARGICHDATLAADSLQEAFLSIWRSRGAYRPELGEVHSWVFGIVRNRCLDTLRRNARHTRRSDLSCLPELAASDDVHGDAVAAQDAARLRAQLAELPLAQREVLVMAYFGELSHAEIARELDIPLGTVKGRMRLGLTKLRDAHLQAGRDRRVA